MATSTVENYLKAILHLEDDPEATASVGAIAEALAVTPGTVSTMMRHLADEGLVDYVPRRSVALLPKGRSQALQVVRRHRLIETFLVEVMKLDWSEVHEEAEVLEHVISDRLLRRIDDMLGNPAHDPHGAPIPDENGAYAPAAETVPLSDWEAGSFKVARVEESDGELLNWLADRGVRLGSEHRIVARDPVARIIEIAPKGRESTFTLSQGIAENIHIHAVDSDQEVETLPVLPP